ncbi:hypothetical protein C0993_006964 [Termitomyces sp. T159_Od127]|nr:hypothetical protein C0993_006964 [Termitomyces sp. T159_Od127]
MRPRSSILNLFDPLLSQDSSRDAPSPDSDKENCLDSDLSFFGRPSKAPSPVKLKRRLVDVGDITIDDPTTHPMLTEEDELDDSMCADDNDTMTFCIPAVTPARDTTVQKATPSHACPRTPLAELSIDCDMTPIVRTKMYRRNPPSAFTSSDTVLPASSEISSFASVIDAVTASGLSFAGCPRPSSDCELGNEDQPAILGEIETPEVTITPIDEPSNAVSAFSLEVHPSEKDTLQPGASSPLSESSISIEHPRSTLRLSPPKTPPHDKKRHSIDLATSFHLQLQSEEASFDLLNDKISLFASTSSMDSFLDGMEDDDFDMAAEEAKLQATIDSIQLEDGESKVDKNEDTQAQRQDNVFTASQNSSPRVSLNEQQAPRSLSLLRSISSPPVPSESTGDRNNQCSKLPKETVSEPPTLSPVFCPPPHNENHVALRTPATNVGEKILPPPVAALRIVKRSALPTCIVPLASSTLPISAPITQHASSTSVAHVESAASEPSANRPSRANDGRGDGPRRVPIIDTHPLAPNTRRSVLDQKTMPQGNSTGPRRVVITPSNPVPPVAPVPAPAPSKASVARGLKAPTKYVAGTSAAVSALPRPVSRLPTAATSGIVRPPRAGTGVNVAGKGRISADQGYKSAAYARRVA